jgi:hypothetical protein
MHADTEVDADTEADPPAMTALVTSFDFILIRLRPSAALFRRFPKRRRAACRTDAQ